MPPDDRHRLLVVAPEMPWPANHGARVDIWHRYLGLKQKGWSLALVGWTGAEGPVSPELHRVFDPVVPIPLKRTLGRLVQMIRRPSLAAARQVGGPGFEAVLAAAQQFRPAAIVCESIYGFDLARRLGAALAAPVLIRSHNIEFQYMATQFRLARTARQKLQIAAARLHLRRYEVAALRSAAAVLDISQPDAAFWRGRGVRSLSWVPPAFPDLEDEADTGPVWADRRFDAGYLGNLWAPNNVAAVRWFLDTVLPLIRQRRGDIDILIAGAGAAPDLARKIAGTPNVTLIENPGDALALRRQVRVLINPILAGGGLNTKSLEMLFCASPIVATPFAVAGIPEEMADAYEVAGTAQSFADCVIAALARPYAANAARLAARERFGHGGVAALSGLLLQEIAAHRWDGSWR